MAERTTYEYQSQICLLNIHYSPAIEVPTLEQHSKNCRSCRAENICRVVPDIRRVTTSKGDL